MSQTIRIVTIATDLDNEFLRRFLIPSCATHNLKLTILKPHSSRAWLGFTGKKTTISRYLAKHENENEIILFTDAYDTFFMQGEDYIMDCYRKLRRPVIFSGEANSWPMGVVGCALIGPRQPGRYAYLNSGGYIGRAGTIKFLLDKYPNPPLDRFPLFDTLKTHGYDAREHFWWSDQFYWTLIHLLERDMLEIDRDARIFEFFGPEEANVIVEVVIKRNHEFKELGRESSLYKKDYERLTSRLAEPSPAAQFHFANIVSKKVFMDMYDAGEVPGWISKTFDMDVGIEYAEVVVA